MNLPAVFVAYLFTKLVYTLGVHGMMAVPALQLEPLALLLELVSLAFGGFMLAHLKVQKPKLNAGILALMAGVFQLVANGGGLHWVRFLVMLGYAPAAMWGAGLRRR